MLVLAACSQQGNKPAQEERVPQEITCINNLKEIYLALRIWAGDHDNQFPFNVSTNAGGTLELCAPDKNGFDHNAYLYLKTMTNDEGLKTPMLLVCPQDAATKPASTWENLQSSNITYRFRCGADIVPGNSNAVLAICLVDSNVLYADGWVEPGSELGKKQVEHQMRMRLGK